MLEAGRPADGGHAGETERWMWTLSHGVFGPWRIHTRDSSNFTVCSLLSLTATTTKLFYSAVCICNPCSSVVDPAKKWGSEMGNCPLYMLKIFYLDNWNNMAPTSGYSDVQLN